MVLIDYHNFIYVLILSYNIPCAVTKKVRNSKASEKTTALMLKTIVGVLVYRIKTIIYILLIWNFHQHVFRYIIINKFG